MEGVYKFRFKENVPSKDVEENLFWAVFNTESIFGKPRVRLDASFIFDRDKKVCVIDKGTEVGQHIAQVFMSLITREFGEQAFKVERLATKEKLNHDRK